MSQDHLVGGTRNKVRFPSRGINGYWGRLFAGILLTLFVALNAQVGAISPSTISDNGATQAAWLKPLPAIAELPQTPLKPAEALQPVYVSPLRPFGTYDSTDGYAPGNCTYGVASRLPVPGNWGDANNWAYAASVAGYKVISVPTVGSVAQTSGDSYLGHVAIVESVNPDGSFVIWEENGTSGLFTTDTRPTTTFEFQNFIIF